MKQITAMTIGGSDPSSGAGIQADLKAFSSLGIHGTTVLTCITVQNTKTVKKIIPANPEDIRNQIEVIMEDIPITHVKTGLLFQPEIAKIVAQAAKKYQWHLIVDPVLTATSGDALSTSTLTDEIKKTLLPRSELITPNIAEAEALTQTPISTITAMKHAAKIIHNMGAKNIILKGGHLRGDHAYDVLYDGKMYTERVLPKIPDRKAHGSGCSFSALLTGYLAQNHSILSAFSQAKAVLWQMIHSGYYIGKGSDVLHISTQSVRDAPYDLPTPDHVETWIQLSKVVSDLPSRLPLSFISEVGVNIGYAIPYAKTREEICSINGRIVRSSEKPLRCGSLRFGSSKHIASIILAAMSLFPETRCGMNIRYTPDHVSLIKETEYTTSSFDRANEPKDAVSTMDWGTKTALENKENYPDFIYDTGAVGKEPMIRILGTNPKNVLQKLNDIIARI
ncbi:MAG: bifunctional hydroxymethylpyrimidine kinase/phosphomethylpyrimidine kinase [Candidatus Thermoplasmatota archaeon]|nr:bifunctional hydroxymethylpyrimidine kinase/phosphomethylpyrimidine kinase [Candidatus Thermoplasmatota archaeon]